MSINLNRFKKAGGAKPHKLIDNYFINQNYCYILIIPGFGIISTVVSASSNKNVFGQDGLLIVILQLMQQTICREFKNCYNNSLLQNTNNVRNIIYSFIVTIFVILNNPQITKARSENFKSEITKFFGLSMSVEISEAIRFMLSLRSNNNFFNSFVKRQKMKIFKQLRPLHNNTNKLNPWFVTGFTDDEGCFNVRFTKTSKGDSVNLRFLVTQHVRDAELLNSLVDYFGCGRYCVRLSTSLHGDYVVTKFEDIRCKIIPFFDKYPLQSEKYLDFLDFKKIMLLKGNTYVSLTKESLAEIKQIKSRMNKGRKIKNLLSVSISTPGNKRYYSTTINKADQTKFNQWLAGLIDGDGQFHTTKKGFSSFKIVMYINDKSLLYLIKHKYGGFIKEIAGSNALKYKLQNPKGLINLINDVNGLIRNPIRMLQLNRICVKYNIKLIEPQPLTYNNGWFSGLVDSDGSIYMDEKSWQLIISVTQKNKYLLEPLQVLYGGKICILSPKVEAFKFFIFRKKEVLNLVDVYFKNFPLKSSKASKINLIKDFYLLQHHSNLDVNKIDKFNQWIQFKNKWDKIVY